MKRIRIPNTGLCQGDDDPCAAELEGAAGDAHVRPQRLHPGVYKVPLNFIFFPTHFFNIFIFLAKIFFPFIS